MASALPISLSTATLRCNPAPLTTDPKLLTNSSHSASFCGLSKCWRTSFFSFRISPCSNLAEKSFHGKAQNRSKIVCQSSVKLSENAAIHALLFDCDGVLVDTERDGHRISFNQAFEEKGLNVNWDVETYGELLKIGGGKERMTHYFNKVGWPVAAPTNPEDRKAFIADLHKRKTSLFMDLVETGALPLRPGVSRLIDEAHSNNVQVAVCSTSNEKAVSAIVRVMLGPQKAEKIQIFAGDVVPKKKPDPAIYLLGAKTLGVDPSRCVVIEDSHIGLSAAKSAGMKCVITKSGYTAEEDFSQADLVFDCIGDASDPRFDLITLDNLLASKLITF